MAYNSFAQDLIIAPGSGVKNYAELHITSSAVNNIAGTGTYYKVNGTTNMDSSLNFTSPVNNRLLCNDPVAKNYLVIISLSASVSSSTAVASFGLNKNSFVENSSIIKTTIGVVSAIQAVSSSIIMNLVSGDYIEVILANNTNTNNITVANMNLTLIEI